MAKIKPRIKITEDGPYIVTGGVPLYEHTIVYDKDGYSKGYKETKKYGVGGSYSLCRCGASKNAPFCDGSHTTVGFNGKETARRESYVSCAERTEGKELDLTDYTDLCAYARFCDSCGGAWGLPEKTNKKEYRNELIRQCNVCPSGRLVVWDKKSGRAIEEKFKASIVLIEDPWAKCSGPIWVRGGIAIESANGEEYEVRNRVTLCRCGKSHNKPFCDGTHAAIKFRAKK